MPDPLVLDWTQNPFPARPGWPEKGGLCLLQGPDPSCCSGQEVLGLAPCKQGCCGRAGTVHDAFTSFKGGQSLLVIQYECFGPEPRELAKELHSSADEIRYFEFVVFFFFFK